jgi:hypothetical protein
MEALFRKMVKGLELAGRDWRRVDRCLWEWEQYLSSAAGREEWSAEYADFLTDQYWTVLDRLIQQAVEWEEYEWAAACLLRKQRSRPEPLGL